MHEFIQGFDLMAATFGVFLLLCILSSKLSLFLFLVLFLLLLSELHFLYFFFLLDYYVVIFLNLCKHPLQFVHSINLLLNNAKDLVFNDFLLFAIFLDRQVQKVLLIFIHLRTAFLSFFLSIFTTLCTIEVD